MVFVCNRLFNKLKIQGGRRQFVLSGKTHDYFFPDSIRGICKTIEEALLYYAVLQGYEIALSISKEMTLHFALPTMKEKYESIVEGKSVDPQKSSGAVRRGASGAPPQNNGDGTGGTNTAANSAAEQVQRNAASKAQSIFDGIRTRLIPHQTKSFIVLCRAGLLMEFGQDGGLTKPSEQKIQSICGWAGVDPGHSQTCSVLTLSDMYAERFDQETRRLVHGIEDRRIPFCIETPDEAEISAMLVRLQCRHDLTGDVKSVAKRLAVQCKLQHDILHNIVETVKAKLSASGEHKPRRIEEIFEDADEDNRRKTLEEAHRELGELVGLQTVKTKVIELVNLAKLIKRKRDAGQNTSDFSLHSLLTGNPGTGKTVVARILGKFYYGLGLRTSPKVVEMSVADITSQYNPGEASQKLQEKIAEAMGGVLFIDEIYQFADDEWLRKAFENVLMKSMEDNRDHLTVLGAGYGGEHLQRTLKINPGVPRRFNHPDNTIEFPNYNVEELLEITKRMLKKEGYTLGENTEPAVRIYIEERIRVGKMENAGGARNLIETMIKNAAKNERYSEISIVDIPNVKRSGTIDDILAELDQNFIGLQSVKDQIKRIAKRIAYNEREGLTTDRKYNMQFIGNPGTGKTTIARYMSRVFNAVGLIDGTDVVEVSVMQLKQGYVGQSGQEVIRRFTQAREEGKVLFIDEAHNLYSHTQDNDSFNKDIITAIVAESTAVQNTRVFTILAGYPEPMRHLMNADPGLQRRFPLIVEFPDYSTDECLQILRSKLGKRKLTIADDMEPVLRDLIEDMKVQPHFGNAGTMESFAETLFDNYVMRDGTDRTISQDDLGYGVPH